MNVIVSEPPELVSFVIPCYRESSDALRRTVAGIRKAMAECGGIRFEVIVVDDGSGTNACAGVEGIDRLIVHKTNRGYGGSLKSGINAAAGNWIAITDADDTYPAEAFPRLLAAIPEHDMVVGARPWSSIGPLRRFPKRLITNLASFLANQTIPDLNSGMRVFRREVYESRRALFPDAFSFSSTLTMVALTNHFNTLFIDIPYGKRTGDSKIRPFRDTLRFAVQILRLSLYFRPLRFFIPLSGLLLLLAIARAVRDVLVVDRFGGLSVVLFLMSFQVFFFGLIAEVVSKKD